MSITIKLKKPCANCPFRKDAPLAHWDITHFKETIDQDRSTMGGLFGCHKNNGSLCAGWVINQRERGLPSLRFRLLLMNKQIPFKSLEGLKAPTGISLFSSIKEMAIANFPELKNY